MDQSSEASWEPSAGGQHDEGGHREQQWKFIGKVTSLHEFYYMGHRLKEVDAH